MQKAFHLTKFEILEVYYIINTVRKSAPGIFVVRIFQPAEASILLRTFSIVCIISMLYNDLIYSTE
jgi:hypothetical protein